MDNAFEIAQKALKLFQNEEKVVVVCALIHYKHMGIEAGRKIFKQGLDKNK